MEKVTDEICMTRGMLLLYFTVLWDRQQRILMDDNFIHIKTSPLFMFNLFLESMGVPLLEDDFLEEGSSDDDDDDDEAKPNRPPKGDIIL